MQSRTFLRIASFPVKMARSFLLKILLSASVKYSSSAASIKLPDGGVYVLDDVFVAGVDGVVSEKVTPAFVGVDLLAFVFGILLINEQG